MLNSTSVSLFYVYSRFDEPFSNDLDKHLALLQREGLITEWYRREITTETDGTNIPELHLDTAQLILLLISPDFLASDYCYGIEMRRILERHKTGETIVLPIILRPVHWQDTPFGYLPALPFGGKPVTKWVDHDAAFVEMVMEIRRAISHDTLTSITQEEKQQRTLNLTLTLSKGVDAGPVQLFFSYAREDDIFRKELEKHLLPLKRQGLIELSYDLQISPGENWISFIEQHLSTAELILLLISPDFVASDYCYGVEMKRSLERHNAGEAIVLPIIVRPVHWQDTPFSHLQMLPTDAKPISLWTDRDEAFFDVTRGINQVVQTLLTRPTQKAKEQWMLEGKVLYDTQQYDKALAAYEQALLTDRKDELIYSSIGRIHLKLEHYEAALEAYEQSIRLSSTASAHLFKGMILQRLGKSEDALGAYQKAREDGYQG